MQLLYLFLAFLVIVVLLFLKRPLYQAILGGLIVMAVLYRIPPVQIFRLAASVLTRWSTLSVMLTLYLITFLQRILEDRKQIKLAQEDLDSIFHNRRINTIGASLFIGLMPSAASMLICSEIVKSAADGYLDEKEQACAANWFRHIPESTLPTYTSVLLMLSLSKVPVPSFIAGMIVPMLTLGAIGYFFYLYRIPKQPQTTAESHGIWDVIHLVQHLWTLILLLVLILCFGLSVVNAILIVIAGAIVIHRISIAQIGAFAKSAFEKKMLGNTFLVFVLREFISYLGVLDVLPGVIDAIALPSYLVFALLFFTAAIISGNTGAIAMGTPLAFAAIPDGGMPLMVYLMCICHAASQLSPTHICLVVAADYYKISLGSLIRKNFPMALLFVFLMTLYYRLLCFIL